MNMPMKNVWITSQSLGLLASIFILLFGCQTPVIYVAPQTPDKATLTLVHWKQDSGKITGFTSSDIGNPIWTHPGLLFLVFDYNHIGMKSAIALLAVSGKPFLSESSVPVKQLCQTSQSTIKDGLVATRMIEVPPELSPCLTSVTSYKNGILSLNLDPEQIHVGDEYLILMSTTDSDPLTKQNTLPCIIISSIEKDTGHAQCQLDHNSSDNDAQWSLLVNRIAILSNSPVRTSIAESETSKESSSAVQKPLDEKHPELPTDSSALLGPHLEKKYQVLLSDEGTSSWYLTGFDKNKVPAWIQAGTVVSVYSSPSGERAELPIAIAKILESPAENSNQVKVTMPCIPANQNNHGTLDLEHLPTGPFTSASLALLQSGHCIARILSKTISKNRQSPASIQLDIGLDTKGPVLVGDIYEIRPLPYNNSTVDVNLHPRCQIIPEGTTKRHARCAFIDPPPTGVLKQYYAVYGLDR